MECDKAPKTIAFGIENQYFDDNDGDVCTLRFKQCRISSCVKRNLPHSPKRVVGSLVELFESAWTKRPLPQKDEDAFDSLRSVAINVFIFKIESKGLGAFSHSTTLHPQVLEQAYKTTVMMMVICAH